MAHSTPPPHADHCSFGTDAPADGAAQQSAAAAIAIASFMRDTGGS